MKKNKIGVMFLVSVLALSGIGISYAAFTDTITVHGTVQCASVQFNIQDFSGTWVYKVYGGTSPPTHEIYVDYNHLTQAELATMFPGSTIVLVSSATGAAGPSPYDATFTFDKLFPCIQFKADVKTTIGTIPVKIQAITLTPLNGAEWIRPLISNNEIRVELKMLRDGQWSTVGVGAQVHPTDIIEIIVWVHIPQNNAYQGLTGSLQVTVSVQQWNDPCGQITGPKELNLPTGTINAVYYHYGPSSYWQTVLSNVGTGYTVHDGSYIGWCNDEDTYIVPGSLYNVRLFSSYDQSFFLAHPNWNGNYWYSWPCVNYLINHKIPVTSQLQKDQIQFAIWYFIDHGYTGTDPIVWGMINDALANGKYFVPQTGQNMAVLVVGYPFDGVQHGYVVQHTFIEVDP